MQAALCIAASLPLTPTKHSPTWQRSSPIPRRIAVSPRIKAAVPDTSTVDYSSTTSVFPAEACDTVGGEACDAKMYPEVKPEPEASKPKARTGSEEIDREYVEYNEPKTVFPGEACDELGGEFCEPEYQTGVYKEKTSK
ncbi:light-regulated protein, chloroplastic [Magnolia sinica]|uniref:light-regulated protein, chloroplastic n=1 Tax=Magnolia sinica TaxID=86752 RepID=UPI00265AF3A1|nr:light-regulated protein, chloroplastic [Magnolia sinica]